MVKDLFSIELIGRENIKKKTVLHTIEFRRRQRVNVGSNLYVNENAHVSVPNKRLLSIKGLVWYCVTGAWR